MDWTKFVRKIRIKAPLPMVYDAWANTEIITTWFLKSAVIIDNDDNRTVVEEGDKVEWRWYNYENPTQLEILEANGHDKIAFTFGHGMEVYVQLLDEGEGIVRCTLEQVNIPTDEQSKENFHVGCRQAWSTWIMNLKAWMEHGILLHDVELEGRSDLFDYVNT